MRVEKDEQIVAIAKVVEETDEEISDENLDTDQPAEEVRLMSNLVKS